jgi:hypothetical protein
LSLPHPRREFDRVSVFFAPLVLPPLTASVSSHSSTPDTPGLRRTRQFALLFPGVSDNPALPAAIEQAKNPVLMPIDSRLRLPRKSSCEPYRRIFAQRMSAAESAHLIPSEAGQKIAEGQW